MTGEIVARYTTNRSDLIFLFRVDRSIMTIQPGTPITALDTPQLLIDLDGVDRNLKRMFDAAKKYGVNVRVHFKSLKCTGLARYILERGANGFLAAKLNEAEALVDAGITDVIIANQLIGPIKLKRLAELAKRGSVRVCVDDAENVAQIAKAAEAAGTTIGVLVEVDVGMHRCGVAPGEPALELAKVIRKYPSLRFEGLQGYDGHLQYIPDIAERERRCREGIKSFIATRHLIEAAGIPVGNVTGAGTGTWEFIASTPGITEIQPGSFVLMDAVYNTLRPEFPITQSIITTVISRAPGQYILDAGSKAISKDFGSPAVKGRPNDKVMKLAEEHAIVESADPNVKIGDRFEVYSAHCCATMNLHRTCIGVRKGVVETVWPIESSGRYD
ncbi:MAG: DSD1 family PLP-dependent enzyme [Planctomycetes bacterium]|nr:DSD1 family PLP-dependent enzyme [Planctomycetota bacterium]